MNIENFRLVVSGLIFFFLAASSTAMAQLSVAVGPKVGASFSGLRGADAGRINYRKGLAGGVFVCVSPLSFLSIQPELILQQKGAVNKNEDFDYTEDIKIGYLSIPVLCKLRLP